MLPFLTKILSSLGLWVFFPRTVYCIHGNINIVYTTFFCHFQSVTAYDCAFLYFHFCFRPAKNKLGHHCCCIMVQQNTRTIFFFAYFVILLKSLFPIKARDFCYDNKALSFSEWSDRIWSWCWSFNFFCFCWTEKNNEWLWMNGMEKSPDSPYP